MAKRKIMVKRSTRKGNKVFFGYVSAKAVHAFNADGKSECRVVAGAMYEHILHLNTVGNGKLSAEPIK